MLKDNFCFLICKVFTDGHHRAFGKTVQHVNLFLKKYIELLGLLNPALFNYFDISF